MSVSPMEPSLFFPNREVVQNSHIPHINDYNKLYQESINDPDAFWKREAKKFTWKPEPTGQVCQYNFDTRKGHIFVKWFENAKTNMSYNCVDRNVVNGRGDNVAFYWEGNQVGDKDAISYSELHRQVCKFANVLKSFGLKKGDTVAIYLPMIVSLPVAMLACTRIGVVHSIVFGGYSAEALADRILDSKCSLLVTADGVYRGTKQIELFEIANEALILCKQRGHTVKKCIVVPHLSEYLPKLRAKLAKQGPDQGLTDVPDLSKLDIKDHGNTCLKFWNDQRDCLWTKEMEIAPELCDPVWMNAEDPLFILYTSGSTGKPKGVMHTTGGYMVYVATTFKYVFDYQEGDVYFCTADIGWITGHSYVTYGPLLNGATSLIFEGIPTYPDAGRSWQIIEEYDVRQFYTAPTAIRTLMKFGNSYVTKYKRNSLQIIGSVGEPINPEAWLWYYKVVGNSDCSIVDTYWQTETGGHLLTPLPGCTAMKPGSATFPFFGVVPALLDDNDKEIEGEGEGTLVFKKPWPGISRSILNDHERFESTYFKTKPGYFYTGDGAKRDKDGYYWIQGRVDDMINMSGHLLSTAQVESAIIEHLSVAESAVVSRPHPIKGECLYCFITLKDGYHASEQLEKEIRNKVREKIGPVASPDFIQFTHGLPKTRSGKIMRRILKKIVKGDHDLGDISTLADPHIVDDLFKNVKH